MFRSGRLRVVAAFAFAASGCMGGQRRGPDPGKQDVGAAAGDVVRDHASGAQMTYAELDELTRAYADRYLTLVNMAADAVERDNPSIAQRRNANRARLVCVSSMYDIATNPDPFTRLLDMLIVVTLQSQIMIDDMVADVEFGERAQGVVVPIRQAREDIWKIATRVLTTEQRHVLDTMIWEWHQAHPDMREVAFVRFDDFGASRGKSMVAAAAAGGGLLAPLSESMKTVDEVRLLAERAFYLSKRTPLLVTWTAKSVVYDTLAQPEVQRMLDDYHDVAVAATSAAQTFAELPGRITAERESLERALDEKSGEVARLLADYRAAIADTHDLVGSVHELFKSGERIAIELKSTSQTLTGTVDAVDRTLARFDAPQGASAVPGQMAPEQAGLAQAPPPDPSRPFDIGDYTVAAQELTRAVTELNKLVLSTSGLLEAESWTTRMEEIDALGARQLDRAHDKSRYVIDRAYYRALWIAGVLIGGLILHAFLWALLRRRTTAPGGSGA